MVPRVLQVPQQLATISGFGFSKIKLGVISAIVPLQKLFLQNLEEFLDLDLAIELF
jgi:hypothetical protein